MAQLQLVSEVQNFVGQAEAALEKIERPDPADHSRWAIYNRIRNALGELGLAREALATEMARRTQAGRVQ